MRRLLLGALQVGGVAACTSFGAAGGTSPASSDGGASSTGGSATCSSLFLYGSNDVPSYADVAPRADLDPASFTIEAWVKPSKSAEEQNIASHAEYPVSGWVLLINSSGELEGRTYAPDPNNAWAGLWTGNAVEWDVWQHVAFTYDASTRKLRLFVNGVGDPANGPALKPFAPASTMPLRLGATADGPAGFFHGEIDEVRLSSTVRYPANFTPTYPLSADEPATVGVWRFSEGTGTTAAAVSDDPALKATLVGATWQPTCKGP